MSTTDRAAALMQISLKSSYVLVAKRPARGAHQILQRPWPLRRQAAQVDRIRQLELRARGKVEQSAGAADGILTVATVPRLPDGPNPIDLGVVQVKDGIARAGEGVGHVAADGVVAGAVDAQDAGTGASAQGILEGGNVGAPEDGVHGFLCQRSIADLAREVAAQAVRFWRQIVRVIEQSGVDAGVDLAERDDEVREGAFGDAAAAGAGGEGNGYGWHSGDVKHEHGVRMWDGGAVAGHAVGGPIEERGRVDVLRIQGPVPVPD